MYPRLQNIYHDTDRDEYYYGRVNFTNHVEKVSKHVCGYTAIHAKTGEAFGVHFEIIKPRDQRYREAIKIVKNKQDVVISKCGNGKLQRTTHEELGVENAPGYPASIYMWMKDADNDIKNITAFLGARVFAKHHGINTHNVFYLVQTGKVKGIKYTDPMYKTYLNDAKLIKE